jgi:16S rRNA (guanine(966)-N(2))-methyltransferase RsmD
MEIIAGTFKNRKILAPPGLETRPTSSRLRGSLFNICQTYIEGARFLDLFAGSGAMGIEAISRGAAWATFVENDRSAVTTIRKNVESLGIENQTSIMSGDCLQMLQRMSQHEPPFQIIYLDPPYEKWDHQILTLIDTTDILEKGGFLFIEEAKRPGNTLTSLELVSERRAGRSQLFQYQKK